VKALSWDLEPAWALLNDVRQGARLLFHLPAYLRRPLSTSECRQILQRRCERREDDFLDLVRHAVYGHRLSPYRQLLESAGCEFGDLEHSVRREGLERTLRALFQAGIYLTTDEYKSRRPVVRGNLTLRVDPRALINPLITPHYWAMTSGSRGKATRIPLDLACIRDRAVNMFLALAARGGESWRTAIWGIPALCPVLWYSAWGRPAARWFFPLHPGAPGVHPRYRWSSRAMTWTGRLAGVRLPSPEHVTPDAPLPIARWMEQELKTGGVPHLWAFPSAALRLCRAASDAGLDLSGARFTLTGEPITETSLATIRGVRAEATPDYGSADSGGSIGQGCQSPQAADDIHVFSDLNALIQADAPPFPRGALLLTSIRSTAPFIFLNMSLGDRATMTDRRCGCPMDALGWTTHLHSIRSYEKLTAGGVTFADSDVVPILEEVLPRRFGGGPSDYQLVEELEDDGRPRLRLLIHPSLAGADPDLVAEAFLAALGNDSATRRVMALQLKQDGFLRVERKRPWVTSTGKVLHLWVADGQSRRQVAHDKRNRP
jgi:hypothetical protein